MTTYPGAGARRLRPAVFLRIATEEPIRAWTGVGGFKLPPDGIDPTGGRYLGVGWMRNLPVLNGLLNGAAESVTWTLSGVDSRTIELVDASEDIRGVRANLGLMFFGPDFVRRQVRWWRRYRVDMVGTREIGLKLDDAAAVEMTVNLTLGSARTSRRVSQPTSWTHAEQSRLHPGDLGCAPVGRLGPGATRPWPPKG